MTSEDLRKGFNIKTLCFSLLRPASFFLRGSSRAFIEKDFTIFFRSIGQWSQVLLLFAIIIIYLFSIKALPIEWSEYLSVKLRYIISFFNIGLVGFVITAVASRLVLPLVENEGAAFWIVRVSPVTMRRFLWSKFFIAFLPLLVLSQTLIVVSNIFLGVKTWFMFLGVGTCLAFTASITGLAVGTGAYNTGFSQGDTGREQAGFRGAAYMLSAFAVITVTILLEIIPSAGMFLTEISKTALTPKGWTIVGLLFLTIFVLNAFVLWLAMKMGEKKLLALE